MRFYLELAPVAEALHDAALRSPGLAAASPLERLKLLARAGRVSTKILAGMGKRAADYLGGTSSRFRRFIDAQLQIFAQAASRDCAYLYAAVALAQPLRGMYTMRGGAQSLPDSLAESIRKSGGTVRLNTPALRLAYDSRGRAAGVQLLSGETVEAGRAVISNLTVWDTYGKLVGAERTPPALRSQLKASRGWGAYLLFLNMEEGAAGRLPNERVLVLDDWQEGEEFDPERSMFMFSASPGGAAGGARSVTVSAFTDAEQWFSFHTDEAEHEAQDQRALEALWGRVHAALPELGSGVEVVETATPRAFYERTRRRLGMVGGTPRTPEALVGPGALTHRTIVERLFIVGDTVFPGNGLAAVTHSALAAADEIERRKRSR
ncbi:MAG TPA: FAD-dependent oxidoreductase [Pyrinomonadaceae bacterium]|nr:FAD-dependent oxidoreductase [Pyrinomonadaceae bacterium]